VLNISFAVLLLQFPYMSTGTSLLRDLNKRLQEFKTWNIRITAEFKTMLMAHWSVLNSNCSCGGWDPEEYNLRAGILGPETSNSKDHSCIFFSEKFFWNIIRELSFTFWNVYDRVINGLLQTSNLIECFLNSLYKPLSARRSRILRFVLLIWRVSTFIKS